MLTNGDKMIDASNNPSTLFYVVFGWRCRLFTTIEERDDFCLFQKICVDLRARKCGRAPEFHPRSTTKKVGESHAGMFEVTFVTFHIHACETIVIWLRLLSHLCSVTMQHAARTVFTEIPLTFYQRFF